MCGHPPIVEWIKLWPLALLVVRWYDHGIRSGGHLTHSSSDNLSNIRFNAVAYGVAACSGLIDMNEVCASSWAKLIIAATSAYLRQHIWGS
ncbi:MAG: hypothetical protein ACKESB_00170 [Candidatus Hodgkinia cicadicola]